MNPALVTKRRRLVPRWRTLSATLQSGELSQPARAANGANPTEPLSTDLLMRLERWRFRPALVSAAELVEAAIVDGRETEAVQAARRIVSIEKMAAPLIRQQAARLLLRTGHYADLPNDIGNVDQFHATSRVRSSPDIRDALAWVELALAQTISRADRAAARSMLVALSLAPNNRHVLRSAARLYLHQNDPERAHAIVARSLATPTDPWLIASEIALAEVAQRPSKHIKIGMGILSDGDWHPRQLTELAGAVGTQELISGNRKKSRRLFGQSLSDPTGNALAQGEWAANDLGVDIVPEAQLSTTFENAEATAFYLARYLRFDEIAPVCRRWSEHDPFSVRPFEFGTVTSSYVEDFETALQFAADGLKLRPSAPSLLNGLAFAAASLNRTDEAAVALARIPSGATDPTQRLVSSANRGLIAFRCGDFATGQALYQEAIDGFRRSGAPQFAARAQLYLAREAMTAGLIEWPILLKTAQESVKQTRDQESSITLALIQKRAFALLAETPPPKLVAPDATSPLPTMRVSVTYANSDMLPNYGGKE